MIFKEIILNSTKYDQHNATVLLHGRRNFLLNALISPLLINALIVESANASAKLHTSVPDDEFVIVDGWVLLLDDLIDTQRPAL